VYTVGSGSPGHCSWATCGGFLALWTSLCPGAPLQRGGDCIFFCCPVRLGLPPIVLVPRDVSLLPCSVPNLYVLLSVLLFVSTVLPTRSPWGPLRRVILPFPGPGATYRQLFFFHQKFYHQDDRCLLPFLYASTFFLCDAGCEHKPPNANVMS